MEEAKKFAEAYFAVVDFIGFVAGVAQMIEGDIAEELLQGAVKAREAVKLLRPLTSAEMDWLRYEQSEKLIHEGQTGKIMAVQE